MYVDTTQAIFNQILLVGGNAHAQILQKEVWGKCNLNFSGCFLTLKCSRSKSNFVLKKIGHFRFNFSLDLYQHCSIPWHTCNDKQLHVGQVCARRTFFLPHYVEYKIYFVSYDTLRILCLSCIYLHFFSFREPYIYELESYITRNYIF